jgi:immune inhibitor A
MKNSVLRSSVYTLLIVTLMVIVSHHDSYGVPAMPGEKILYQADGTRISAILTGDEFYKVWKTSDGYTIAFDEESQNWTYAITDNKGNLIPSPYVVGVHSPPKSLAKNKGPEGRALKIIKFKKSLQLPQRVVPSTGTANIPVIVVNFKGTSNTYSASDFETLLFGTNNKSMKDFYEEVSYGAFSVSSGTEGVSGWYDASKDHDYYGQNANDGFDEYPGELVIEAVSAADAAGFNFADYDMDGDCYVDTVAIVHQGTGEEAGGPSTDIWSHKWNLESAAFFGDGTGEYITDDTSGCGTIKINEYIIQPEILGDHIHTMGVFAHEYGHALGLPDLYDTDGSSEGIGNWGLMAGGSWNGISFSGDTPSHMTAWSKFFLGWITPTIISDTTTEQTLQIKAASNNADVYQFLSGSPGSGGEYFLVENRQPTSGSFDEGLPGSGLAIWHIDESMKTTDNTDNAHECNPSVTNCASTHYRVALVQADGKWDLEDGGNRGDSGDLFPGSSNNRSFTSSTEPNSNMYNGSSSGINFNSISGSDDTMTIGLSSDAITPINGSIRKGMIYDKDKSEKDKFKITIDCGSGVIKLKGKKLELQGLDNSIKLHLQVGRWACETEDSWTAHEKPGKGVKYKR